MSSDLHCFAGLPLGLFANPRRRAPQRLREMPRNSEEPLALPGLLSYVIVPAN